MYRNVLKDKYLCVCGKYHGNAFNNEDIQCTIRFLSVLQKEKAEGRKNQLDQSCGKTIKSMCPVSTEILLG